MKSTKELIVCLLFALIFGVSIAGYKYNTSHLVLDWNMADVGQTYMCAVHLLEGKLPYEDFNYQWGPYALYLNAYFFKFFGIKISVVRIMLTSTVIIVTALTYLLARKFLPMFHSWLVAFIVHITLMQNILVPYANIFVIPLGLIIVLLIIKYHRTNQEYLVLVAGLLCGVAMGLKFSAGLFTTAGATMGLIFVSGQHEASSEKVSGKFAALNLRLFVVLSLITSVMVLIWAHLTVKYFLLFVLPVILACFEALILKGRVEEGTAVSQRDGRPFRVSLLLLIAGALLSSIPWLAFYLFRLDATKFFYYLIGSAVEHSKHIFIPYPEMNRVTSNLLIYTVSFVLIARLVREKISDKYVWLIVLLFVPGYIWIMRSYLHLTAWFSLIELVNNITFSLGPVVSIAASIVLLLDAKSVTNKHKTSEEHLGIIMVIVYHVFFFLVAYPHTEFTHLSWSFPTAMILLFFLLERARMFVKINWPQKTRKTIGRAFGGVLTLSLPVLIIFAKLFPHFHAFYTFSPDLLHWSRKEYVKLSNERADIYEFVSSAVQIELIDRFIQANTERDEYLFEFPTTFFYFYSQRKNPTRWDYFYPGLHSGKEAEIIEDLERVKPRFAIIYDNPYGWMFTYDKIKVDYQELADYINNRYEMEKRIGYFRIMRRRISSGEGLGF